MSNSSTREDILSAIYQRFLVVDGVKTVRRKPISSASELEEIANSMFPVVTIQGGLPVPQGGNQIELGEESFYTPIRSEMDVFIRVFGYEKETPDTAISTMLNIIYPPIYYDPTFKGYNFTSRSQNNKFSLSTDDVVLAVDNVLEPYQFKHYKSLTDYGLVTDFEGLPFSNPALFTDVTDTLEPNVESISARPSDIVEYRDPYYIFTVIMTVTYNHSTIEI